MWRVLILWAVSATTALGCEVPRGAGAAQAQMFGWINSERAARDLGAYQPSGALAAAARRQACDMADYGYFGHSRAGAPKLGQRIAATGYRFRASAENLAWTTRLDPAAVGRMWRRSPGHWAAIIDPGHRDVGLAITVAGGRIYWVMVAAR